MTESGLDTYLVPHNDAHDVLIWYNINRANI